MNLTRCIAGLAVCLGLAVGMPAWAADQGAHATDPHADSGQADEGHGTANTNPLSFDPDLSIFTAIVFGLLLLVLYKFAWGPIIAGLEKREHGIAEHIAGAQKSHDDAKALLAQYEARLAQAQDEVRSLLDQGRRDAETLHEEILAKARAEAEAERNRSKREIELAKDQALHELVNSSANLAVDLAGKIVKAKLNRDEHAALIAESLAKFPTGGPSVN